MLDLNSFWLLSLFALVSCALSSSELGHTLGTIRFLRLKHIGYTYAWCILGSLATRACERISVDDEMCSILSTFPCSYDTGGCENNASVLKAIKPELLARRKK